MRRTLRAKALSGLAAWLLAGAAHASGASPYLPLNLSPEIERKIERVLLLGRRAGHDASDSDRPACCWRCPRPASAIAVLCAKCERYLDRYFGTSAE